MRRVSLKRFYVGILAVLLWVVSPAWAAPATPVSRLAVAEQQVLDENASLEELSERLDQIRQGVTSNANDDLLAQLRMAVGSRHVLTGDHAGLVGVFLMFHAHAPADGGVVEVDHIPGGEDIRL